MGEDFLWLLVENWKYYPKTQKTSKNLGSEMCDKITKKMVSVRLLLKDGDDMEENLEIMNVKYKGIIMEFRRLEKYGLYHCWACRGFGEAASVSVIKK